MPHAVTVATVDLGYTPGVVATSRPQTCRKHG